MKVVRVEHRQSLLALSVVWRELAAKTCGVMAMQLGATAPPCVALVRNWTPRLQSMALGRGMWVMRLEAIAARVKPQRRTRLWVAYDWQVMLSYGMCKWVSMHSSCTLIVAVYQQLECLETDCMVTAYLCILVCLTADETAAVR
jgi:hypothetical protein